MNLNNVRDNNWEMEIKKIKAVMSVNSAGRILANGRGSVQTAVNGTVWSKRQMSVCRTIIRVAQKRMLAERFLVVRVHLLAIIRVRTVRSCHSMR